ncbi:hypothetical protein THAOC_08480, partial [Thalassiosira oceanica]
ISELEGEGAEPDRRRPRQQRAAMTGDGRSSTRPEGKADRAFAPAATRTPQFNKENVPNPSAVPLSNRHGQVGKLPATRGASSRGKKANRVQAVQAAGGRKALANQLKRRFGGNVQQMSGGAGGGR